MITRSSALKQLGLAHDATDDDIKKAYRKLAMQHHPDRGGNETKFKEIQSAYEYLQQKPAHSHEARFDWSQFEENLKRYTDQNYSNTNSGKVFISNVEITLAEAFHGVKKNLSFSIVGEETFDVNIPPAVFPNSRVRLISTKDRHGQEIVIDVRVSIKLPKEVDKIIWAAEPNLYAGAIEGSGNIEQDFAVRWLTIMQGGWGVVTCFDGRTVNVRIPAGIEAGTRLKMRGHGYWKDMHKSARGDILLKIVPEIPSLTSMSDDELQKAIVLLRNTQTLRNSPLHALEKDKAAYQAKVTPPDRPDSEPIIDIL